MKSTKSVKTQDNLEIFYETRKGDKNKFPVFLMHGIGGNFEAWEPINTEINNAGFPTISMDLRGNGFSSHPQGPEDYTLEKFAKDIEAILKNEKIQKIHLVGHCFGSIVATYFASNYPKRLASLTLTASSYKGPNYMDHWWGKSSAALGKRILKLITLRPHKPGHYNNTPEKFLKDYDWPAVIKTMWRNSPKAYMYPCFVISDLNLLANLKTITAPTLVVAGSDDTIFPVAFSKTIHQHIPNSRLEIMEGANHVLIHNNSKEAAILIKNQIAAHN